MFDNILSLLFIGIVIGAIVWETLGTRPRHDPTLDGPAKEGSKPFEPYDEPAINLHVKDERWLEGYKQHVALSGSPNSLSDEMVTTTIADIVNSNQLNTDAKYHMLDALQMRVWNDHPHGMAADVIETINDEMEALRHPEWHGRDGSFVSVKKGD